MTHKVIVEKDHKKVVVTWDDRARAAYIRFFDGKITKTKEVSPGLVADFSSSGRLLGLEILDPENLKPLVLRQVIKRLGAAALSLNPAAIPDLFAGRA